MRDRALIDADLADFNTRMLREAGTNMAPNRLLADVPELLAVIDAPSITTGLWCNGCDVFEDADAGPIVRDVCTGCGCSARMHVAAKVVPDA